MPPADNGGVCSGYFEGPNACPPGNQLLLFMTIVSALKPKFPQFCENKKINDSYDFIVVGGGSAGAVVAARLSEVQDWNILLIEAGPEEPINALVPSMVASYLGTELDWNYTTTGEKNACLAENGACSWPRGKNLGGTSVHNYMMYSRGNEQDYAKWGINGWRWEDVLPYFKRSEDNKQFFNEYHQKDGPLHVAKLPWQPDISKDILDAGVAVGCGRTDDLNGKQISGFTVAQTTSNNGQRISSATAFLRPVRSRQNLHVLLKAQVIKVLFADNKSHPVATGVEFVKDGKTQQVHVNKEIILSAGVIGSPHILLLSGVGPHQDLKAHNIECVKDIPGVGKNLQNHVALNIQYKIDTLNEDFLKSATDQYIKDQSGPISATGISQITGICASNKSVANNPDLQFFFQGYSGACYAPTSGKREVGIVPTYLHPKSRGTLKLKSNNPFEHPIITQNYLSSEEDVEGVLAGIDIAQKLFEAPSLKKYNPQLLNHPAEVCKQRDMKKSEYWVCVLKQFTSPGNHQVGSCKMGTDGESVVDPYLRVHGVERLRIADGSVIPKIISGNTVAPIMMIGERIADFIKKDHFQKRNLPEPKDMTNKEIYPYTPYLY